MNVGMSPASEITHIVVAGSTGEVGRCLVRHALLLPGVAIHALTRRPGTWADTPRVDEVVFDFDAPEACDALFLRIPCDVLLIALGTTTAKAGKSGLLRVDRDYPLRLIQTLERLRPEAKVGFCSSAGADRPRGYYLMAKHSVEERLQSGRLASAIARPSLLVSQRREFRLVEKLAVPLMQGVFGVLKKLLPSSPAVWKYAPISVEEVAEQLLFATLHLSHLEHVVLEGKALRSQV